MSVFNFKNYIKNVLNEKLQSDIFIHDILDDTDGMFKYYKISYDNTLYAKALDCAQKMRKIINNTINTVTGQLKNDIIIDQTKIDTDEKLKVLHAQYMNLYNSYVRYITQVFKKPDPQLLSSLLDGVYRFFKSRSDIYNITDKNFKKYTLAEIKSNKVLKQQLLTETKEKLVFWFNKDKAILAVSLKGIIILKSINFLQLNSGNSIKEQIENSVKKDNITVNNIVCPTISCKEELEWPTVQRMSFIGDKREIVGIDFIQNYLDITADKMEPITIGSFISKASHIYKETGWGNNIDDYLIIYTPTQSLTDKDGNTISSYNNKGYNQKIHTSNVESFSDLKHKYDPITKERKNAYKEVIKRTYKWTKDILGKYKPYAGGKDRDIFSFGVKLCEYSYNELYGDDNYCNNIAKNNLLRYKKLVQLMRHKKSLGVYTKQLEDILKKIKVFTISGSKLNRRIKETYKTDKATFKSLMLLYGTYTRILNTVMVDYSSIQSDASDIKTNMSIYTDNTISQSRKSIESKMNNIIHICDELQEIQNKMDEILDVI